LIVREDQQECQVIYSCINLVNKLTNETILIKLV